MFTGVAIIGRKNVQRAHENECQKKDAFCVHFLLLRGWPLTLFFAQLAISSFTIFLRIFNSFLVSISSVSSIYDYVLQRNVMKERTHRQTTFDASANFCLSPFRDLVEKERGCRQNVK